MSLIIQSIETAHYKNYKSIRVDFHPKVVAVVGDNGMGKTNLIDAIYYSCIGKSYLTSSDRNVVNKDIDFFRIKSIMESGDAAVEVLIKVQPGKSKTIEIQGDKLDKISDLIGNFPIVMVAPVDIQILLEGSEPRRLFMNNGIVQYSKAYLNDLLNYNRILKQRNAYLKSFAEKRFFDHILIQSIDHKMEPLAKSIHRARQEFVERLGPLFTQNYNRISGAREECKVQYKSQLNKKSYTESVNDNIEKDKILARSTVGIHKDDLVFIMNDEALKTFASQGQLKSYILALKLAQYQLLAETTNKKPILLLDDLFDKLDTNRVSFLLDLLMDDEFGQIFITDTDIKRVPGILTKDKRSYQLLKITEGKIEINETK